ncbi:substrate-binding protein domain-containing protein [Alteribacillus bidgolensis]|uniref:Substrate-binding protein domain-containing protein n=1 Tax=Alteribacillus bidgolensis TaxID=930129 RepID=A0A1G8I808_9BACI|nr:substrate-binding protein domain-containing protein [Alteribacillus bidgolensis]
MSETSVRDAELLAIEEINENGGVLGKELVPIIEDGASDEPTFSEKASKLLQQDEVHVIFGGWTSSSRKAMLPGIQPNIVKDIQDVILNIKETTNTSMILVEQNMSFAKKAGDYFYVMDRGKIVYEGAELIEEEVKQFLSI